MPTSQLTASTRTAALREMSREPLDILVVGGGVTGAGIALDAAARGLRVGIVDAQDWSAGTSSRSSRLVHGGLRYLYNLDFGLVAESLRERGRLLTTTAPHLVKAQPFLWPLKMPVIERAYSAIGVGMYDAIAHLGSHGNSATPFQKHLSKKGTKEIFPDVRDDSMIGAIRFYDARVDDARLVITLVRTAQQRGALAASRAKVTELTKDASGTVTGAMIRDLESGQDFTVAAHETINATGVWTEDVQQMSQAEGGLHVLASKGIHIVIPKDRIKGETGIFLRTEKSVLFIIPWPDHWIIGTTDTPWTEDLQHPVATKADVDYVLEHANAVLASHLTHDDILATFAGLRPLLQPGTIDKNKTAKVSREHTVTRAAPGLSSIAGGKLTTYRVMAEDAVDFALGARAKELPSTTATTPLAGAEGFHEFGPRAAELAARHNWDDARVEHLLSRYGSMLEEISALIDDDPSLGTPIASIPRYLRAEAAYAVTHEGALHLEDILTHRIRLAMESRDRGTESVDEIVAIVAPLLGWSDADIVREVENYRAMVAAEVAASRFDTDSEAVAARIAAPDLVATND